MLKKIILPFIAIALSSCASPKFNYIGEMENISWPSLGEINTVNLGEDMVHQGHSIKKDALVIENPEEISFTYSIPVGNYVKTGADDRGSYFSIINTDGVQIIRKYGADPVISIVKKTTGELCVITIMNLMSCNAGSGTSAIKKIDIGVATNSLQQTLIYSGKVGNKIKLSYREFKDSMARQAFTNNAEYDLEESNQIGYKGALIEVIKATNQSITYKVIRNFNTPK